MAHRAEQLPSKRPSEHQLDIQCGSGDFQCPCGRVVPRPRHKYGDVQANDHSIIFQGNVEKLVLYCQPEDLRYPLNPRTIDHDNASGAHRIQDSSADSSPTKTGGVPFAGLQRVNGGHDELGAWENISSFGVESAWLVVSNAIIAEDAASQKDPGSPSEHVWDTSRIIFEVHHESALRRIRIVEESDAHVIWIPETSIKVYCSGKSIEIYFSNCNNLQNAGHYSSQDQRAISVATYDAKKPNVKLRIDFEDELSTVAFRNTILQTKRPSQSPVHESSEVRVARGSFEGGVMTAEDSLFMWKKETKADTGSTYEYHDILRISDRFDLELSVDEARTEVLFRFMSRLRYRGIDEQPKLPWEIARTPDGGPAKVSIDGADRASELRLSTSSHEVRQLVNAVTSKRIPWHFETFIVHTKVKSLAMKNGKLGKSSTKDSAQLSLWSNKTSLRMLLRCSNANANMADPEDPVWCSMTFEKNEVSSPVNLKNNKLIFDQLPYEMGDFLAATNLRPSISGNNHHNGDGNSALTDLELEFDQSADIKTFRSTVTSEYLQIKE